MNCKTPRIFLSYAKEDKDRVIALYQKLKNAGYLPWMDEHDLSQDEKGEAKLSQQLQASDFIIFFLSKNSIHKSVVFQKEMKIALENNRKMLEKGIHLIPAWLDETELPDSLVKYHTVNPLSDDGWRSLLKAIIKGMAERGHEIPSEIVQEDVTDDQSALDYLIKGNEIIEFYEDVMNNRTSDRSERVFKSIKEFLKTPLDWTKNRFGVKAAILVGLLFVAAIILGAVLRVKDDLGKASTLFTPSKKEVNLLNHHFNGADIKDNTLFIENGRFKYYFKSQFPGNENARTYDKIHGFHCLGHYFANPAFLANFLEYTKGFLDDKDAIELYIDAVSDYGNSIRQTNAIAIFSKFFWEFANNLINSSSNYRNFEADLVLIHFSHERICSEVLSRLRKVYLNVTPIPVHLEYDYLMEDFDVTRTGPSGDFEAEVCKFIDEELAIHTGRRSPDGKNSSIFSKLEFASSAPDDQQSNSDPVYTIYPKVNSRKQVPSITLELAGHGSPTNLNRVQLSIPLTMTTGINQSPFYIKNSVRYFVGHLLVAGILQN